ncbi:unnamed protein product [Chironomus riparius]|uniref:Uncharacterized protein n=1 Tax=Chironomus riparius TaxID=315576 RepID=A0A9N9S6C4_9DIPT|nr:unnamed protein product [Chironomus riparius]
MKMRTLAKTFIIVAVFSLTACSIPESPGIIADTIRGFANKCTLKCPSRVTPVPNPNYQKTFNGCGSKGITVDPSKLPRPQFEQCCNSHDYCYDTCNIKKDECDTAFRNCMLIACGNAFDCDTKVCKANTEAFYNIVKQLGCSSYLEAQKGACLCK